MTGTGLTSTTAPAAPPYSNGPYTWDQKLTIKGTSSSTDGSTSIQPALEVQGTMTGAGGVGGRALFSLAANAALGGWSNALKGIVTYSTSGSTAGLGSAIVAELVLSSSTTVGTYAPLESEIVVGASGSLGTATSFLYMNFDTTGEAAANAGAFLFELGSNIAAATGEMYDTDASAATGDATLKIRINGVTKYLLVADDAS